MTCSAKSSPEITSDWQCARKTTLEVQQTDPLGRNCNADHAGDHAAKLFDPRPPLGLPEVTLGCHGIFRYNTVHGLQAGGTADQKHLVRKSVVIDRERDLWVLCQGFQLRRLGGCSQH